MGCGQAGCQPQSGRWAVACYGGLHPIQSWAVQVPGLVNESMHVGSSVAVAVEVVTGVPRVPKQQHITAGSACRNKTKVYGSMYEQGLSLHEPAFVGAYHSECTKCGRLMSTLGCT